MTFGSNSKNLALLNIIVFIVAVMGFFIPVDFSTGNLLMTVASFYVFNLLGLWLMHHRYYAHKNFKFKHKFLEYVGMAIATLAGRGSIIGWTYIHRLHHKHSDTNDDPHSPSNAKFSIFGFNHFKNQETQDMKVFLVKDLMTPLHLFIHKWYVLIILSVLILGSIVSLDFIYFAYVLPVLLVHISQINFNYFGHLFGYRNFATKDHSTNNPWLFPFILGEAWHNNHHHSPNSFTTKVKNHELDPVSYIIKLVGITK